MMINILFILFLISLITQILSQQTGNSCPPQQFVYCAYSIYQTIQTCSGSKSPHICVNQLAVNSQQCFECLCSIAPDLCLEIEIPDGGIDFQEATQIYSETFENDKILDLNKAINLLHTCGPLDIFKCQNHLKMVVKKCQNGECDLEMLKNQECGYCLCTIFPKFCDQAKKLQVSIPQDQGSNKQISFIQNLYKLFQDQQQNHKTNNELHSQDEINNFIDKYSKNYDLIDQISNDDIFQDQQQEIEIADYLQLLSNYQKQDSQTQSEISQNYQAQCKEKTKNLCKWVIIKYIPICDSLKDIKECIQHKIQEKNDHCIPCICETLPNLC